jgi:hypothetical protein
MRDDGNLRAVLAAKNVRRTETVGMLGTTVRGRWRRLISALVFAGLLLLGTWRLGAFAQDRSDYPDGYDAVQAAPRSHKVIFENALVRVLEVTMPAPGQSEPMHHHRWPSFFLDWDTGGKSPHIRYHRPDGSVRDSPSENVPTHSGRWVVHWMKPEPMHAIEVVENDGDGKGPPSIRVEIKTAP